MDLTIPHKQGTNIGGICPELRIIPVEDVAFIPDVIELQITEEIELVEEKEWFSIRMTRETAHPVEKYDGPGQGGAFPFTMPFNVSKISRQKKRQLLKWNELECIADYKDLNGTRILVGTIKEPAVLLYKQKSHGRNTHDRNQYDLVLQITRRHALPFYNPPGPPAPPPPPPPPPPPVLLEIGDEYQGGVIGYLLQEGDIGYDAEVQHGIIAAPSDLEGFYLFGCSGVAIGTQGGIPIGTGGTNTMFIVATCPTAGTAAVACDELVIGIYDDWFLPSYDELYQFYLNRALIGGFFDDPSEFNTYMSSTEAPDALSTIQVRGYGFSEDFAYTLNKTYTQWRVRAARYF